MPSAIADFAAKQTAFNDQLEAALTGLEGDINSLNDTIKKLQDSAGTVTPEDQALIDALVTKGQDLSARFKALDDLTPPSTPSA